MENEFTEFHAIDEGETGIEPEDTDSEELITSPFAPGSIRIFTSILSIGQLVKRIDGGKIDLAPTRDLISLRYSFGIEKQLSSDYRATNTGFGLSYTLPVLVAILSAKPGALLLFENPESHLHPKGQAKIGELMAKAANCGVQIVVETHSDHVLNGIRVAVRKGLLPPENVCLHFFERHADKACSEIISPIMDRNGRIDRWPDYFFDEWDKSLEALLIPMEN